MNSDTGLTLPYNKIEILNYFENYSKIWNNFALPKPYIVEGVYAGGVPNG